MTPPHRGWDPPSHPVLEKAYANTAGAVAYLDETFHRAAVVGDRFYVITAVLVERDEMRALRDGMRELAGSTFWHTTDQLLTEDGRRRAHAMLDFLGSGNEICVIAHHIRVDDADTDLEHARRDCLRAVATRLSAGTAPLHAPVSLLVIEQRNPRNLSNLDRKSIQQMRVEGLIHRSMQTVLTSPKYEHLLWLPDLVALAYRRTFTHGDDSLFSPVRHAVHFVDPAL